MRKIFSLSMVFVLLLSACGRNEPESISTREQVTIALWSDQLTEHYAAYLQETFPEVDFTFYIATNSTDFYRFKERMDDLPDILTVRRFALRDVEDWRDSLMDLSDTELANTFHQSYLRSYTYENGMVNWLPACAEVDGILVNRELLDENGLSLPTTYQEFIELCASLKERDIQPFRSNFGADFTCMELLQGLSIPVLASQEGREWRQQYESGQIDQLSEEVWLPAFERMAEFIEYTGINSDDITDSAIELFTAYQNGETAMIRGTPSEAEAYGVIENSLLLPYFGESEENNWYLTYPAFQVAAKATESPERKQLILNILTAMLNEEGLKKLSSDGTVIAYSKDAVQTLSPILTPMKAQLESNQLYIRLASADMFRLSQQVIQGMIQDKYSDARAAFDEFNSLIGEETENNQRNIHIKTGYSYAFDPEKGSQAASAVMNTLREELGVQWLIGPSSAVAGNISAGDYSEDELRFLTMGESPAILLCEMTGEQLYRYVEYVLATPGIRGAVCNDSTLYVSSGFELKVKRKEDGYQLEQLTVDGRELEQSESCTVALLGSMPRMLQEALDAAGITEYTISETAYKQIIVERLIRGEQLAEPIGYITLCQDGLER